MQYTIYNVLNISDNLDTIILEKYVYIQQVIFFKYTHSILKGAIICMHQYYIYICNTQNKLLNKSKLISCVIYT